MHKYENDFYGSWLRVVICGFIRPEKNYKSLGERERERERQNILISDRSLFLSPVPASNVLACD